MRKTFLPVLLTIVFNSFFFISHSFGQVWHYEHESPSSTLFPSGASQITAEGSYLFFFGGNLVEMSEYGEPMYFYQVKTPASFLNAAFVHKETDGYVTGGSEGVPFNGDLIVKKVGLQGNILWQTDLVRPGMGLANRKSFTSTVIDENELFVAGVDSVYSINTNNGNVLWRKYLPSTSRLFVSSFYVNNEIITSTDYGEIFRLDENGDFLDSIQLNMETKQVISNDINYVAVGKNSTNLATLIFIEKATKNLTSITYGNGYFYDIKRAYDGGFILSGTDGQDAILIKTDATGVEQWRKNHGEGIAKTIEVSPYDGYVLSIYKAGADFYRFLKTDSNGNTDNSIQRLQRFNRTIEVSNIKTMFSGDGVMFWDYSWSYFRAPKNSGVSSIYAAGLWMGGYENDVNGNPINLKMAADTYRSSNRRDYWAGYSGDGGIASDLVNKVWKIKRSELRDFINDIADGTLSRPMPHDILTWPAIGNPHFKGVIDTSFSINQDLAPFFDANGDNIYNAYDGDYPSIKGDEMLLWIFNDSKGLHTNSNGDPINADIIATAYGYDCPSNPDIYNTLFLEYQIINSSSITLNEFFVGMWMDVDLGCPNDDLIGTDTVSNSIYFYNDGAVDGGFGCGPIPTYTGLPPIQSLSFLNQSLSSTMYYVNGGWPGAPTTSDPTVASQFYNYLTGTWRNGSPLYNTGNGYNNQGNASPTKYIFNGNPSDNSAWSFCTENLPGADSRTVSSTGPYQLLPGSITTVKMAYTFHENIPLPCPDVSTTMRTNISSVKTAFDSNTLDWVPDLGLDKTIDLNSTVTLTPKYSGTSYQWSDNSNSPTLDISSPGLYSVTITDVNGCQKTDNIDIYGYTDTNSIESDISFKVFPNPVNDVLNVDFEVAPTYQNLSFHLTNTLGQIVLTENIENTKGMQSFPVGNLATGVYFLSLLSDNEVLKTEKIVVE